jgi:single-strand DNA-binding protein
MDLNRATIIGRLTRDPELKSLASGKSVTTMSVATSRVWTDANGQKQKQSEYHNVVMWGKLAETAGQYLKKASRVYIEGRLQTRDWTGQDGVKRYRTEIVADNMIMLDGRPSGLGGGETGAQTYSQVPTPAAPREVVEEEIKVEDIPF